MSKPVEIIIGYVESPAGVGLAASSLTDQYNSDKSGFALVNQSAQTGAAVAGVTSIVKLTAGFTPFLNIKTNTLAATTVFLKITAQYRTDKTFDTGDVISLVGNVAGIVGSVLILAGGGPVGLAFTAVGVGASVAGTVNSDAAKNLYRSFIEPLLQKHFVSNPEAVYPEYWVAPDFVLVSISQIKELYAGRIAVSQWDPDTQSVVLGDGDSELYGAGSGGGYVEGGAKGPFVFPLPEAGWSIDIGPIEVYQPDWSINIGPIESYDPGGNRLGIDRYY